MSPKATLERGSIVVDADGRAITSVADVRVGDDVRAYLADGQLVGHVGEIVPGSIGDREKTQQPTAEGVTGNAGATAAARAETEEHDD